MAENPNNSAAAVSRDEELRRLSVMSTVRAVLPIVGLVIVFIVFNKK